MISRFAALLVILISLNPLYIYAKDDTTDTMIKQIDFLQNKHSVLAENIANVSTPRYITKDIEKPGFLDNKSRKVQRPRIYLKTTNPRHLAGVKKAQKYDVILDKDAPMKPNKNNVDLTKQVTNMAQNSDEVSKALKNYKSAMDLVNSAIVTGGQ